MSQTTNQPNDSVIKESITLRGVCASIQSMSMPTINNLISLLNKVGIKVKRE